MNSKTGETTLIKAANNRHFYGHGCLSADESVLFTTENDFNGKQGVIGLRDAASYHVLGEYPSYGIGPHDIHLMPDGKTLVVANGGILTHLYEIDLPEVSGIQFLVKHDRFICSTAKGQLVGIKANQQQAELTTLFTRNATKWDNHLMLVS